ncbi:hypothetical protein Bca4012_052381 [Brassica carinata]|uniref:Uncharacterized protein n=3 Tax=Brassica TaxID=3705 RepID=A0ABQ7X721_BRANA|nr:hypothetical protein Bca52824_054914 [Brassica carinata]KAH0851780.1 hypothetical protein HID58_090997 [Brassica napus]VDD26272.1 unnamed protein product [Brassica oleracea]
MVSQRFLSSKIKTTEDDFNEKKQNSEAQATRQVTYTTKPHSPFHNGHQESIETRKGPQTGETHGQGLASYFSGSGSNQISQNHSKATTQRA